jgi:signal transduction histidine kinase
VFVATAISEVARNILRYAGHGEVVLRPLRRNGASGIAVIARDDGPGVADGELQRLFERFYRTSSATERSIPGIGLGLSICRAIAEGHGGTIRVASEEGRGTTFTVELPLSGRPVATPREVSEAR